MRNFMKSNNPMLSDKTIAKAKAISVDRGRTGGPIYDDESTTMTVSGAVTKTMILVSIMMVSTFFSYMFPMQIFMPVGALGGAAVFMLTSFKPHLAPMTGPIYALLKGLFVGTISAAYAFMYQGIIFQALSLTMSVLMVMLIIHKSGLIPVTKKFRRGVTMAVGAIMIVYLISWIGHFVGFQVPFIHESGPMGIGITVVIIGVASLNLLLDFDNFEKGEQGKIAKQYEWYFGMGLLFTLVWLYVEFLRLLSKLQSD